MWEWLKQLFEILKMLFIIIGSTMSLFSFLICLVLCIRTSQISHKEEEIKFMRRKKDNYE